MVIFAALTSINIKPLDAGGVATSHVYKSCEKFKINRKDKSKLEKINIHWMKMCSICKSKMVEYDKYICLYICQGGRGHWTVNYAVT